MAGILPGTESKFVGHIGLTEVPEGKSVTLEPLPEEDELYGAMVSEKRITGTEAAEAGVGTSEDVADLPGGDLPLVT